MWTGTNAHFADEDKRIYYTISVETGQVTPLIHVNVFNKSKCHIVHSYSPSVFFFLLLFDLLFDLHFEFIGVTSIPINTAQSSPPLHTCTNDTHTTVIGFITGRVLSSCSLCKTRGVEMKFSLRKSLLLPGI